MLVFVGVEANCLQHARRKEEYDVDEKTSSTQLVSIVLTTERASRCGSEFRR